MERYSFCPKTGAGNQNSNLGAQGSTFYCVIRSKRYIPLRDMCLTHLKEQKFGVKKYNK